MQTDEGQEGPWQPGSSLREKIARTFSGDWLPRIIVESMLIVLSILAALAVSEWERTREDEELATQALAAFEREIRQNRARLEDAAGEYRVALRNLIAQMDEQGALGSSDEFQSIIGLEPLRPAFLTSTVWETALTTGALPHIDFDVVNALSLTYALQARVEEFNRSGMPELARGGWVGPDEMHGAIQEVTVYLSELNRSESELLAAYDEVLRILEEAFADGRARPSDSVPATASRQP